MKNQKFQKGLKNEEPAKFKELKFLMFKLYKKI